MRNIVVLISCCLALAPAASCSSFSYNFTVGPFSTSLFGHTPNDYIGWSASWQTGQILYPGSFDLMSQPNFTTSAPPAATYFLHSLTGSFFGSDSFFNFLDAEWLSTNPNLPNLIYSTRLFTSPNAIGTFFALDTDTFIGQDMGSPALPTILTITQGATVAEPSSNLLLLTGLGTIGFLSLLCRLPNLAFAVKIPE